MLPDFKTVFWVKCMELKIELNQILKKQGVSFVHFVDISSLSEEQNKQYPNAILIGIVLSASYLQKITQTPNYKQNMVRNNEVNSDEFHLKELKTDELADFIADFLEKKGFLAYSQSEKNIYETGFYNEKTKSTPLPHKIVAGLAGIGWIGKHNLLVTPEFGSAISMCTVLTNAPLETTLHKTLDSKCGTCKTCQNVCRPKALKGNLWHINGSRDEIVNVFKCTTCIECMVFCPWTQAYVKRSLQNNRT
jgi:epoxyqueuosine reductase